MGWKYTSFRISYELKRRIGLLRFKYPVAPPNKQLVSLSAWRDSSVNFFWGTGGPQVTRIERDSLKTRVNKMRNREFQFFSGGYFKILSDNDWLTNPKTGYTYSGADHWTSVPTFNPHHGDIKYVWERSRFCFLYDIVRYDYHFKEDLSKWTFKEILSWIASNPINCGPNFSCSQEISIRSLNWLFTLHYYRDSPNLNENTFSPYYSSPILADKAC